MRASNLLGARGETSSLAFERSGRSHDYDVVEQASISTRHQGLMLAANAPVVVSLTRR